MICKKCKKQIEEDSIYCRFCGKKQAVEERPRKKTRRPHGAGSVVELKGARSKPFEARIRQNERRGGHHRAGHGQAVGVIEHALIARIANCNRHRHAHGKNDDHMLQSRYDQNRGRRCLICIV